jgi:hypothetical protein
MESGLYSDDYLHKFYDYLNWENVTATSLMGLVENAPQEAIDAYEKYKKLEKERLDSNEDYVE